MEKTHFYTKGILKNQKNNNFAIFKKQIISSVILIIVCLLVIIFSFYAILEILPIIELFSLDFGIMVENTLLSQQVILENRLVVKKLENIFYFSVTSDREYFLERILLFIKKEILNTAIQSVHWCSLLQDFWINTIKQNTITNLFENTIILTLVVAILPIISLSIFLIINQGVIVLLFPIVTILLSLFSILKLESQILDIQYINYLDWLISESFINKNIYIDSNYFLTNDATKGIERFSDLVIPWLVDNEDMETWGGSFKTQTQVSRIQERERHFIMNDYSNLLSPNLYNKDKSDGTFFGMLEKPVRRVSFLVDLLLNIASEKELIEKSWINIPLLTENSANWLNPNIINNIWPPISENITQISPTGFYIKSGTELSSTTQVNKNSAKKFTYDLGDDELDFILPQKNNITGDSIARVGNLRDRKQIVYRGAVNTLPELPENREINSRRPDFTKNTNYIFEKTLQNERTIEYGAKEHLKKYIKNRFSMYWPTKPESQIVDLSFSKKSNNSTGASFKLNEFTKIIQSKTLNTKVVSNINKNPTDLFLNKIAQAWKLADNFKHRQYARRFEYNYNIFNSTGIATFENANTWVEVSSELLKNRKLGIGAYTYTSTITAPWIQDSGKNYLGWRHDIKQTIINPKLSHWGEHELGNFYLDLQKLLRGLGKINEHSDIFLKISKICLRSWTYNNYSKNNLQAIFLEVFKELNSTNIAEDSKLINRLFRSFIEKTKIKQENQLFGYMDLLDIGDYSEKIIKMGTENTEEEYFELLQDAVGVENWEDIEDYHPEEDYLLVENFSEIENSEEIENSMEVIDHTLLENIWKYFDFEKTIRSEGSEERDDIRVYYLDNFKYNENLENNKIIIIKNIWTRIVSFYKPYAQNNYPCYVIKNRIAPENPLGIKFYIFQKKEYNAGKSFFLEKKNYKNLNKFWSDSKSIGVTVLLKKPILPIEYLNKTPNNYLKPMPYYASWLSKIKNKIILFWEVLNFFLITSKTLTRDYFLLKLQKLYYYSNSLYKLQIKLNFYIKHIKIKIKQLYPNANGILTFVQNPNLVSQLESKSIIALSKILDKKIIKILKLDKQPVINDHYFAKFSAVIGIFKDQALIEKIIFFKKQSNLTLNSYIEKFHNFNNCYSNTIKKINKLNKNIWEFLIGILIGLENNLHNCVSDNLSSNITFFYKNKDYLNTIWQNLKFKVYLGDGTYQDIESFLEQNGEFGFYIQKFIWKLVSTVVLESFLEDFWQVHKKIQQIFILKKVKILKLLNSWVVAEGRSSFINTNISFFDILSKHNLSELDKKETGLVEYLKKIGGIFVKYKQNFLWKNKQTFEPKLWEYGKFDLFGTRILLVRTLFLNELQQNNYSNKDKVAYFKKLKKLLNPNTEIQINFKKLKFGTKTKNWALLQEIIIFAADYKKYTISNKNLQQKVWIPKEEIINNYSIYGGTKKIRSLFCGEQNNQFSNLHTKFSNLEILSSSSKKNNYMDVNFEKENSIFSQKIGYLLKKVTAVDSILLQKKKINWSQSIEKNFGYIYYRLFYSTDNFNMPIKYKFESKNSKIFIKNHLFFRIKKNKIKNSDKKSVKILLGTANYLNSLDIGTKNNLNSYIKKAIVTAQTGGIYFNGGWKNLLKNLTNILNNTQINLLNNSINFKQNFYTSWFWEAGKNPKNFIELLASKTKKTCWQNTDTGESSRILWLELLREPPKSLQKAGSRFLQRREVKPQVSEYLDNINSKQLEYSNLLEYFNINSTTAQVSGFKNQLKNSIKLPNLLYGFGNLQDSKSHNLNFQMRKLTQIVDTKKNQNYSIEDSSEEDTEFLDNLVTAKLKNSENSRYSILKASLNLNVGLTKSKTVVLGTGSGFRVDFFSVVLSLKNIVNSALSELFIYNIFKKNKMIWKIEWDPIRLYFFQTLGEIKIALTAVLVNTQKFTIQGNLSLQEKNIDNYFKTWGAPEEIKRGILHQKNTAQLEKIVNATTNFLAPDLSGFVMLLPRTITYLSKTDKRDSVINILGFQNKDFNLVEKLYWYIYCKIMYERTWLIHPKYIDAISNNITNLTSFVEVQKIIAFSLPYSRNDNKNYILYTNYTLCIWLVREFIYLSEVAKVNFAILQEIILEKSKKIFIYSSNSVAHILVLIVSGILSDKLMGIKELNIESMYRLNLKNTKLIWYLQNFLNNLPEITNNTYKRYSIFGIYSAFPKCIYHFYKITIVLQDEFTKILQFFFFFFKKIRKTLPQILEFPVIMPVGSKFIVRLGTGFFNNIGSNNYIFKKSNFTILVTGRNKNNYWEYANYQIKKKSKDIFAKVPVTLEKSQIFLNKKILEVDLQHFSIQIFNLLQNQFYLLLKQVKYMYSMLVNPGVEQINQISDFINWNTIIFIKQPIKTQLDKIQNINIVLILYLEYNSLIAWLWLEFTLIELRGWLVINQFAQKIINFLIKILQVFESRIYKTITVWLEQIRALILNFNREVVYLELWIKKSYWKIGDFIFNINLKIKKIIRDFTRKNITKLSPILGITQSPSNNLFIRWTFWEKILKNLQIGKVLDLTITKKVIDYSEIRFEILENIKNSQNLNSKGVFRYGLYFQNIQIMLFEPILNFKTKYLNKQAQLNYKIGELSSAGFSTLETSLRYLHFVEGGISMLYKQIFSGIDSMLENRGQLIWLNICILFDFIFEFATEADFSFFESPLLRFYEDAFEVIDDYFSAQEEGSDDFGLLGWTFDVELGEDPGNDFATINDFFELPADFEKWMRFDTQDLLHVATGLDSPELGELYPSFDITIPIKSLWLVGVFYYNPNTGGTLMLDLDGLVSFAKILFIDRRITTLSNLYQILEFRLENVIPDIGVFLRLKIYFILDDFLQILEMVYINPLDFIDFFGYYIIFLSTYFGITTPILVFILLLYFGKINKYFEKEMRRYSNNDFIILKFFAYTYNYFLYRFFYHAISNIFIFVRMTFATMLIITGIYVITEGMHIFGVLRVLNNDQENTKYLGGLYFQLERDPFIEKHVPSDEVWDEFKYDSQIDDEWSRIHFHRENSEILGGTLRESGTVMGALSFGKKFDYVEEFEHDEDGDDNTSNLRETIDQIHNRVVDESSFGLKFIEDTELEREFFREFEMRGAGVEGSVSWLNRSRASLSEARHTKFGEDFLKDTFGIDLEFRDDNFNNTFYDYMLYNVYDPRWLYNETTILSERETKPAVFNHSMQQMYNSVAINNPGILKLQTELLAKNRLVGLVSRNKGAVDLNPHLDVWDQDYITDYGIRESSRHGTTYGSLGNLTDTWLDAASEPITQLIRHSITPAITDSVYFNHAVNDDLLSIDFYKNEKILLESNFDAIKRVRLPLFNDRPIQSFRGIDRDKFQTYDDSENYQKEENKGLLDKLDKNDLNMLFLPDDNFDDGEAEDFYFDWLFWDLNDNSNILSRFINNINLTDESLSLKNIRRRDLFYNKFDGIDRPGIFKESILRENKKTDTLYKIYNTLNKYRIHNANAFFINNEHESKDYAFSAIITGGAIEEAVSGVLWQQKQPTFQMQMNTNTENNNHDINPNRATDDITESLWGVFENYYDGGLKLSLNAEQIKFKDYKLRHYKKYREGLYSYLVPKENKIITSGEQVSLNPITEENFIETLEENFFKLEGSLNVSSGDLEFPIKEKSEHVILIEKEFKNEEFLEKLKKATILGLADFTTAYSDGVFENNPMRNDWIDQNQNLFISNTLENNKEIVESRKKDGLTEAMLNRTLKKFHRGNISKLGIFDSKQKPVTNLFWETTTKLLNLEDVDLKSKSNFEKTGISSKQKIKYFINTHLHNTGQMAINAYSKDISQKNIKWLRNSISKVKALQPLLQEIKVQTKKKKPFFRYQTDPTFFLPQKKKESNAFTPKAVTEKYANNIMTQKLSKYIQKFNTENKNYAFSNLEENQEDVVSDIIYNTILEDSWSFDNKFKLNFSRLVDQDYNYKIPRVVNTLQDAWDLGEGRELLNRLKKQKLGEFSNSDSWDQLQSNAFTELENEEFLLDSFTNFATIDTGANPLINNPDENHWGYMIGKNQNFGTLRNSIDYLSKDVFLELKNLEESSVRELGYTWKEYAGGKLDKIKDISAHAPQNRDTYTELADSFSENLVDTYITKLWTGEKLTELPGFNLENSYDDLGINLGKKIYKNMSKKLIKINRDSTILNMGKFSKQKPWGLDYTTNYEWSGTQIWNLDSQFENFGNLFAEKKYKIWDMDSKKQTLDKISGNDYTFKKLKKEENLKLQNKKMLGQTFLNPIGGEGSKPINLSILPENPIEFLNEKIDNIDFIGKNTNITKLSRLIKDSENLNKTTIFDKVRYGLDKKIKNLTQYSEYEYPNFNNGDKFWVLDSELNHNWAATTKQDSGINKLNFLQRSLKQKVIMQEYFTKNMQVNTQVSNFREANDLMWYLKKRKKRLKLNKLLGRSPNSRITNTDKSQIQYKDWDSKIGSPTNNYSILFKNYDTFGYDKEDAAFSTAAIDNIWVSNKLSNLVENTKLDESVMDSFDMLFELDEGESGKYNRFIEKRFPIKKNKVKGKPHLHIKKNNYMRGDIELINSSKLHSMVELLSQGGNFLNKIKLGVEKIESKRPAKDLEDFLEWNLLEDSGYADSQNRIGLSAKLFDRGTSKKSGLKLPLKVTGGIGRSFDFENPGITVKPKMGSERLQEIIREIYLIEGMGDREEIIEDQIQEYSKKKLTPKEIIQEIAANTSKIDNDFTAKKLIFDGINGKILKRKSPKVSNNLETKESLESFGWTSLKNIEDFSYSLAETQTGILSNSILPKISPIGGTTYFRKLSEPNWLMGNGLISLIGGDPQKIKSFENLPNISTGEVGEIDKIVTNSSRSSAINTESSRNDIGDLTLSGYKNSDFWGSIIGEPELTLEYLDNTLIGYNQNSNLGISEESDSYFIQGNTTSISGKNYEKLSIFDEEDEITEDSGPENLLNGLNFGEELSSLHIHNLYSNQKLESSGVFKSYGKILPRLQPASRNININQFDTNFEENAISNLFSNPEMQAKPKNYFSNMENNQIYYKALISKKNKKQLIGNNQTNMYIPVKKGKYKEMAHLSEKLNKINKDNYHITQSSDFLNKFTKLDWSLSNVRSNLLTNLGGIEPTGIFDKSISTPIKKQKRIASNIWGINIPELVEPRIDNYLMASNSLQNLDEKSTENYSTSNQLANISKDFGINIKSLKNTGTLQPETGWIDIKLKLLEYNKLFPGIIDTYDFRKNIINLDTNEKTEPIYGNSRFRDFIPNTKNFNGLGILGQRGKLSKLTRNSAFLEKYKLLREAIEPIFPENDNRRYINKDIDGFFSDGYLPTDKIRDSYIKKVAMPVSFVLGKQSKNFNFQNNIDYLLVDDLGKLAKQSNQNQPLENFGGKYDKKRFKLRKKINNLLRNSAIKLRSKHKKRYRDGVHKYTAYESIIPSPYIRSLSIESNLFSKINSLRIFGAGRLEDLVYRPKLKQLLRNGENLDPELEDEGDFDEFITEVLDTDSFEDEDLWGFETELGIFEDSNLDIFNIGGTIDTEIIMPKTTQKGSKYLINNLRKKVPWSVLIEEDTEGIKEHLNSYSLVNYNSLDSLGEFGLSEEMVVDNNSDFKFELNIDEEESEDVNNVISLGRIVENFGNNTRIRLMSGLDKESHEYTGDSIKDFSEVLEILEDTKEVGDFGNEDLSDYTVDVEDSWKNSFFDDQEDSEDAEMEYLEAIENDSTKNQWLLDLYEDLVSEEEERVAIRERLTEEEFTNLEDQLTNMHFSNLRKRERNQELSEKVLHLLENSLTSGNIYSTIGDVTTEFQKLGIIFGEDNKNSIMLDQEDLEDKLLFNLEESESDWDTDEEDLLGDKDDEDIEDSVLDQSNILIPITPKLAFSFEGFEKRQKNSNLNQNSLDFRLTSIVGVGQNKRINYPSTFDVKEERSNLESAFIRNVENRTRSWGLGRNDFDGDMENLDESEQLKEYNLDDSLVDLGEISGLIKLKRLDSLQEDSLKLKLSEYFIGQVGNSTEVAIGDYQNQLVDYLTNNAEIGNDGNSLVLKGFEDTNSFWNLKHKNKNMAKWSEIAGGVSLKQKTVSEQTTIPKLKRRLGIFTENYNLAKSALGLTHNTSRNSTRNLSNLFRKGAAAERVLKPRIKWKKLKKTYINRLDIVERFLSSIKNSENKLENIKKTNKMLVEKNNNSISNVTQTTKPIHSQILKFFLIENGTKDFRENKQRGLVHLVSQNKINKNQKYLDSLEKTWGQNNSNLWNTLKNMAILSESPTYQIFDTQVAGTQDFDKNQNQISPRMGQDSIYINGLTGYREIASNVNQSSDFEDFEDGFNSLDDLLDSEDDNLEIYSRVRNNMVKLMQSKKNDSILPTEVISAFLAKLPNVDITSRLGEELKKPFKYSLDKKKMEDSLRGIGTTFGIEKQARKRKQNFTFRRLNAPVFNRKSRIIDEFSVHHKRLQRVGAPLKNKFYRFSINPFNQFSTKEILLDRGLEYGMGNIVYRNNAINRRSDDLQERTFGPEIRLDSTVYGYGKLDKALDQNLNSEEDYGLLSGLGFPEIVEQNVFDETNWVELAYGGSVYSSKFTDFIWMLNDDREELDYEEEKENRMNRLLFGDLDDENSNSQVSNLYKSLYLLGQIFNLNDYKKHYRLPAGYNRFFSTSSQHVYDMMQGNLQLAREEPWLEMLERKDELDLKRVISESLQFDENGLDVSPLGFEEGESLYDSRLLNRGWFPEKILWGVGVRSTTKVGSDPNTLELLADYKKSFAHEAENFGKTPEREAFRSLGWAKNPVFDIIDDVIEGIGIEEDIPYSPAHSEKLWHYFEYESRPNSEKLEETPAPNKSFEDSVEDEEEDVEFYGPDSDPTSIGGLKFGNFNLLGLNDFIVGSRVWGKTRYLGGLDQAEVPGVSLAIADNELYDGLRSDFHNFLTEKLPSDPLSGFRQTKLPLTVDGLFGATDTPDSKIPEFSRYIMENANMLVTREDYIPKEESREMDRKFYMNETFRPKDEFSFAPTTSGYQHFEPEWVVNGEGWLGNNGSNKAIVGFSNLPLSYTNPISTIMTQPRGIHSLKVLDDLDSLGGIDSPYFSLGDFTNNRLIRGRNNDTAAFPILSSWNSYTGGRSDDVVEEDNWFSDDTPMTEFIEEVGNFITFENTALNQRDLWWRSVESGSLGIKAKKELAMGILKDNGEKYRDFLLAYDYKLFGKSWLNPQDNSVPLKSYAFYNDSEINSWTAQRDDNSSANSGIAGNYENQLYGDYTYGLFVNSDTNIENSLEFYSIGLRDYLFYIYNIGLFYATSTYLNIYEIFLNISEFVWNYLIFKNEIIRIFMKLLIITNTNIIIIQYLLYPILDILNGFSIIIYSINLSLTDFSTTVLTIHDGGLINNNLYFEFLGGVVNYFNLNKYINTTIFAYTKYTLVALYFNLILKLVAINIIFFFILVLI